jgi:DNA-binding response OmpR family regulator
LYVEDDMRLGFVTRDNLERKGYAVTLCKTGREAEKAFLENDYDLCILDVMLPEMDGFTLARKIRERNEHIPILFLSAKSLKEDRIEGFTSGGDDYLTKPYSIDELILKIEVFLKRNKISNGIKSTPGLYSLGNFIFDYFNMQLTLGNKKQRLTSREAELLHYMAKHVNEVIKKEDILREVWDNDSYFNSRSLDVFISKLRKHLSGDPSVKINNIHGIGFILVVGQ